MFAFLNAALVFGPTVIAGAGAASHGAKTVPAEAEQGLCRWLETVRIIPDRPWRRKNSFVFAVWHKNWHRSSWTEATNFERCTK